MVKSKYDVLKLIRKFPGISYTEIRKTIGYDTSQGLYYGSVSNILTDLLEHRKIFRVHDNKFNKEINRPKSFYFDISLLSEVVQ